MEVYAFIRQGANTQLLPSSDNLHLITINYSGDLVERFHHLKDEHGAMDYFFHNAGMTVSLKNQEYYDVNVGLTKKLARAIKECSFLPEDRTFGYTSSYAAHGPENIKKPVSHYGESKLQAEQIVAKHFKNHLIARPTAIYGAGDVAFLPLFKSAKLGIYPVTNGHQRMSMIHAADLSHMIVHDLQSKNGIIHYSDGKTYFHRDFISTFSDILQKKIRSFPLPKWLARLSMGASDVWHKIINKRPGITLEKFSEISQHWDLHTTNLPHSSVSAKISLQEGFEDALNYYQKQKLL